MEVLVEKLTKTYKEKVIFQQFDCRFPANQINGLMGDNGVGKSTLLQIIAGLDHRYQGKIYYDGNNHTKEVEQWRTMVFQKPYLLRKNVWDNIAYPLKLRKVDKKQIIQKVTYMMQWLEIAHLAKQYGHKLSGGESQKVALARALVFQPQLVLLDEPMSGIDANSITLMEQVIMEYQVKHQANIIMISHNAQQVKRMCNHVIQL